MPSPLFLRDSVVLYNSLGEVNHKKTFQETTLSGVKLEVLEGVGTSDKGYTPQDDSVLYVFFQQCVASEGRTYLPHRTWSALTNKGNNWTVKEGDYFIHAGRKFNVVGFSVYTTGAPSNYHIKVVGK